MALPETPELAEAAVEGGADLLEIGFPFSDPLADGPVIRLAGERALARGMRTRACLECLAEVRSRVDVPLVPMTYAHFSRRTVRPLWRDAQGAGATSLIVADLPIEAEPELPRVQLVAPTTSTERIRLAAQSIGQMALPRLAHRHDWGPRVGPAELAGLVERARGVTDVPLLAGFGISTPDHAAEVASFADGIVVGNGPYRSPKRAARKRSATTSLRSGPPSTA